MSQTLREKVALLVFLLLILLTLGGLGWYLTIGHSWNVAASTIDDATGQMDGYTAILYEGTLEESKVSSQKNTSSTLQDKEKDDLPSDSAPSPGSNTGLSNDNTKEDSTKTERDSVSPYTNGTLSQKETISLAEVSASYLEKNAHVLELDVVHPYLYKEGMIIKKGAERYGIFSVDRFEPLSEIRKKITYCMKHEVDYVIAITPDASLFEKLSGVDVVISTKDEGIIATGETHEDTFYVNVPIQGSVGAIVISPHNVVSAKVIQEL